MCLSLPAMRVRPQHKNQESGVTREEDADNNRVCHRRTALFSCYGAQRKRARESVSCRGSLLQCNNVDVVVTASNKIINVLFHPPSLSKSNILI